MIAVVVFVVGVVVGAGAIWLVLRARIAVAEVQLHRIPELESQLEIGRAEHVRLLQNYAELQAGVEVERRSWQEKLAVLEQAEQKLADAFRALSADALRSNNEQFLQLAHTALSRFETKAEAELESRQKAIGELVAPLRESLSDVNRKLQELEVARVGAYSALTEHVKSLADTQNMLRSETANLVKALRAPAARGRWGEIQLKRVVEMAGMIEYCDFVEQQTVSTAEGRIRPDVIVRLPNERRVVVDAKVPLAAYLEAHEAADDCTRAARLKDHAAQLRTHLSQLGGKSYWAQFDTAPDFVVAFLPGEAFFSAALESDPGLIEYGIEQRVLVATPTTLIALLKAIAYGWRQENIARNAQEISRIGRELYERVATMGDHFMKVGTALDRATLAYNQTVGTLESRVLVSARRLKDKGIDAAVEISAPEPVERSSRPISAPELAENTHSQRM